MKNFQNENTLTGWGLTQTAWIFLNAVFDHAAPVLSEYGLHQKSLVLLALLDEADTPQQVAHLLRSPASTVSHLLREIEDKGLIERAVDSRDKRRFRLKRTNIGDAALRAGIAAVNAAVRERFNALEPEQRELLEKAIPLLTTLATPPIIPS